MKIALLHAAAYYLVKLDGEPLDQTVALIEAIKTVSLHRDDISWSNKGESVEVKVRSWTQEFSEPEPLLSFARSTGALEQDSLMGDDDPDGYLCRGAAIRLINMAASYTLAGGSLADIGLRHVVGPIWMVGWGASLPVDLAGVPGVLRTACDSVADALRKAFS